MRLEQLARLDLNLLTCLQVLLEEQSVSRSAIRLHLTQSAISKSLARLREMFDDPLFVRSRHGLVPTPRAEILQQHLGPLLMQLGQQIEPPVFNPQRSERHFNIACIDNAHALFLPYYFASLLEAAPGLSFDFPFWDAQSAEQLELGQLDLAIGRREQMAQSKRKLTDLPKGTEHLPLTDDHQVVILRQGHPALARPWSLSAYLEVGHVQAINEGKELWMLDLELEQQRRTRRKVARVPSFHAALSICCNSDLAFTANSLFGYLALQHYPVQLLPLPLKLPPVSYLLLWHQRFNEDPGHRWLRNFIYRQISANLPPVIAPYRAQI